MDTTVDLIDWRQTVEAAYRTDGDRLWRAILASAGDPDVASEAVAEAYAQALRRGASIRGSRSMASPRIRRRSRRDLGTSGRPMSAQKHKVMTDAAQLAWLDRVECGDTARSSCSRITGRQRTSRAGHAGHDGEWGISDA